MRGIWKVGTSWPLLILVKLCNNKNQREALARVARSTMEGFLDKGVRDRRSDLP
jgi:hypothetical protein